MKIPINETPPTDEERNLEIIDSMVDGRFVRRAIEYAEMLRESPRPFVLVISQHHYEDPAFMEQLGNQPYVVTPRFDRREVQEAAKRAMMEIVDRGHVMLDAPKDEEPRHYESRPSFRERFPSDPVRNRKARKGWRRR